MIYSGSLRLRAIEREDIKLYFEWLNDPEVIRHLSMYLPLSMLDEEQWFESQQARDRHERPMAIELQGEGWKLVGTCSVFAIDWVNRSAELGIMIGDKSVWNQGIGTQVMIMLQRHCFETLNLNRVFLRVDGENVRGRRAYQKAGFVEEGCLRQAVFNNGRYEDMYIMSVLRSEWDAHKARVDGS
jgi:RimJ/RimL family protein N-acetyltransferase